MQAVLFNWWRVYAGADLGIFRGGGGGAALKFCFLGWPNWFSELSQTTIKTPQFDKIFCAAGKFVKKKQAEKAFLSTFRKILTKKLHFLEGAPPQNKCRLAPKAPLEKFKGQSALKKVISNSTEGDPLGPQGVESLRGKTSTPP